MNIVSINEVIFATIKDISLDIHQYDTLMEILIVSPNNTDAREDVDECKSTPTHAGIFRQKYAHLSSTQYQRMLGRIKESNTNPRRIAVDNDFYRIENTFDKGRKYILSHTLKLVIIVSV